MNDLQNSIVPIWQPVGYSTYQITTALAKKLNIKAAHTGVLDPLAEGVIIVLTGDERFKKIEYSKNWKKGYVFDIALGIATDSYDGLGLITKLDLPNNVFDTKNVQEVLKSFIGEYEQTVPLYSATKKDGKKLFLYPKLNLTIPELPTKKGIIYDIFLEDFKFTNLYQLITTITARVGGIEHGIFRQQEVKKSWDKFVLSINKDLEIPILTVKVTTSSGLYVRSLSQDICSKLNCLGFVSNLIRNSNGVFTREKCLTLDDLFGESFLPSTLKSQFKL